MTERETANDGPLARAVPWGRSFDEYNALFDLSRQPFAVAGDKPRILDVAAGPASFAAEAQTKGWDVIACDPLYALTGTEIARRVEAARPDVMALVRAERARFVWDVIESPEALERQRLAALEAFLADYEQGKRDGRYRDLALPDLGLADDTFDLALCSNLLFLYADSLDAAFHKAALREMLRVAAEVRVFPLQDMSGQLSSHLDPVIEALDGEGYRYDLLEVPYEFRRGDNRMLRILPDRI